MGFWSKIKRRKVPTYSKDVLCIIAFAEEYGLSGQVAQLRYFIEDDLEYALAVGHMVKAYLKGYTEGLEEE